MVSDGCAYEDLDLNERVNLTRAPLHHPAALGGMPERDQLKTISLI